MGAEIPAGLAAGAPSDDELLAAARQGDTTALETLLVRTQPHLYRFGLRMCGNVEDAGDVAQESLISMAGPPRLPRRLLSLQLALHHRAPVLHQEAAPKQVRSYARRVAGHAWHRRCPAPADPTPNPEQTATNRELATALTHAIDGLEPSQREVLVLRETSKGYRRQKWPDPGHERRGRQEPLHRARVAIREELAPALGRPGIAPPRGGLCPDVLTLFSQHLEGEIDPSVCATMEAHLAQCHHCRDACESLKRTLAICRQLPTPDVPASLAASVRAAIHAFLNQR